jgi:sugar transferase (PEP-CTERM system associated)
MVRLFSHWFPSSTVLQVAVDAILMFGAFGLAAMWLGEGGTPSLRHLVPSAALFAVAMVAVNSALGVYQRSSTRTLPQMLARVALSLSMAVPIAYAMFSVLPLGAGTDESVKVTALFALAGFVAVRGIASYRGTAPIFVRRVLVLGTSADAVAVEQSIKQRGGHMSIVGFYPVQNGDHNIAVAADRVFSGELSLVDTVRWHEVDDVVVAVRERRGGSLPLNGLLDCKLLGVRVLDLSSYYERTMGQVRLDSLHASWLIFGEGFRQGVLRTFIKRMFDICASLVLLVLAIPVMLVTAALIAAESGTPVLYRQERVGQAGRVFRVIKFRSMQRDAEGDGKPRWAASNDDRVTRVGRVIRKLRIDELPQLINVLMGDMSLVGPRPERPFFVDKLSREIPFYAARHSVKPGVTGWAQVRYHYGSTVDDAVQKLQYDLYYVKNHTLFLDVVVLFETIGVVLTGKGAQ